MWPADLHLLEQRVFQDAPSRQWYQRLKKPPHSRQLGNSPCTGHLAAIALPRTRLTYSLGSKIKPHVGNIQGQSNHLRFCAVFPQHTASKRMEPILKSDLSVYFASLLILAATNVLAASPPTVGDKAPDFQLSTVEGKRVSLSELTPVGPVVLVVLRGYPGYQCPYCNRQFQDFTLKSPAFAAAGARVVMVYPGPPQELGSRATEFMTRKSLPENFFLLLDPGYRFTDQYGLRWDEPNETAYPSTFVLDRHGVVVYSKSAKVHGARTTAAEILDVLPKTKPSQ